MIPSGLIAVWSGAVVAIPTGWFLCDGNNGTPDLRARFIVGAGGAIAPDATGGSENHTHTFTGDGHTHTIPAGTDIASGADLNDSVSPGFATGTTDNGSSLPPWYGLAFIMKS